jgi:hypothetical protein
MKRLGTVLVFADGVTKEQAEAALAGLQIRGLLAPDYFVERDEDSGKYVPVAVPPVHEFEGEYGGPVWYVP